ncbi:class I SAM-dependent methyltransferase [Rhizobium sp. NTR19]|uniref:Class I SAM-dependent methyltransferase n=1 Tax=Neorhizobium turbinariae TaxID=2937795 RepID=A0ABT0IX84_9HYPH|nr:methyltransferase domain-containing protein [Neorhizobium turbinariae]MCK8782483.1 class I SAM-dependent methyltransferase [Neorhizobium turbinariae]
MISVADDRLACPDCRGNLSSLEQCEECGRQFAQEDGRPKLMPLAGGTVNFSWPAGSLTPAAISEAEILRFPPRRGQSRRGIYHLDRAHEDRLSDVPAGSKVLEIGCGGAQMRRWMKERGIHYIGVDVAVDRVHDWLQMHGGPDLLCDAHVLPFQDETFDVVYASAVWEHLAFPQLASKEVARVLKPGGLCLGSASFLEPWHDSSYYHMTPYGIFMTLSLAGLSPIQIWPETKWPGFRAMLEMGNKATRLVGGLCWLIYGWYLAPKAAQVWLHERRRPDEQALMHPIAQIAGAVAWVARKP